MSDAYIDLRTMQRAEQNTSHTGATLKPRAMDMDSFGNRILRNGRRPENTKAGPRIAEKYQMLKLENVLVLSSSCPQLLLPGVL